jgi:Zn-finger nucleic acid-binding protein
MWRCEPCGGVWLDDRASHLLVESPNPDVIALAQEAAATAAKPSKDAGEKRPCAVCGHEMLVNAVWGSAVQVDVCPTHGTWFDAGELEAVTKLTPKSLEPEPESEPAKGVLGFLSWAARRLSP